MANRKISAAGALLAISSTAASATAAVTEIGPSDHLGNSIAALVPGDELVLRGGTYTLSYRLSIGVSGSQPSPIVIRAKDGEVPHITRDSGQNTINIENARYVTLRGLEVSGGSHGIRMNASSFITVEDCHIHDTADVALSANVGGSYEGLRILRNHIHDTGGTGEGMYLGCNNDACRIFDSLIANNYVHNTDAADVAQGDGIEIKQGSYNNIVRDNVIHDTNYPCILVYGTTGKPQNIIERNAMWNCGDHGIQAEADAVIRNNVILAASANGIHNQVHQQGGIGNLLIVHNTVLTANDALRTNDPVGSVLIANNAFYSQNGAALRVSGNAALFTIAGNVGSGSVQGTSSGFDASGSVAGDFIDADFSGTKRNVFPKAGSKLIAAGAAAHVAQDDFNGTSRGGIADVGAYKYEAAGNPGWPIGPGFKGALSGSGGVGGTSSGGAGGSSGSGTGGSSSGGTGTGGGTSSGGTGTGGGTGSGGTSSGGTGTGGGSAGGAGGSAARSAGGAAGSPGSAAASDSGDDGGCGCRASSSESESRSALGFLALAALVTARTRRRRAL